MTPTRRYFDKHARRFDRLYERRTVRRAPRRSRDLAVSVVARHPAPKVLDVGCGPGRVAEAVLEAGAASYVGIDVSPHMLALARRRLDGHEAVELIEGDFLGLDVPGSFDVVLALGLFDYLDEPARAAAWMRARCSGALVASFPRWEWVKAPLRHLHYAFHRCSIYEYSEAEAEELLADAGFSSVEFPSRGPRGFLVVATS
ncbi:MAG TPA: class I SAM-dependent methyltransferase [Gaiellaceae bacterium]|nr:class I SAM-dependent methyltransferase [Gaiellaceae bacterium]